jgi:hypothetical protein
VVVPLPGKGSGHSADRGKAPSASAHGIADQLLDLADLAMHVGVQAAEVGDPSSGAHAAQKSVALDEQRARAMPGRRGRGGDPGRAALSTTTSYSPKTGVER